jgi:D-alanyl-D-alanine carboxypeptidase/D-alanyl-D-alanine-endopeptidase (penicillin-binding protein 4)
MLRVWVVVVSVLLVANAEVASARPGDLAKRMHAAIAADALRRAQVSVYVVNLDDGAVRFEHHGNRALIPASNMKILTALAALSMFGPTHRFETDLFADSSPGPAGEIGILGVRGGGDPALTSEQIWRLAADLRVMGIRRIKRGLLLDAVSFDSERWHPSWGVISSRAYNAPIGALNANYGAYGISVRGGAEAGEPVRAVIDPPVAHLRLVNTARTVGRRAKAGLVLDRRAVEGGEQVVVSGSVRAGSDGTTHYRSVLDPTRYAGSVVRMQLAANGIEVGPLTVIGSVGDEMTLLKSFEGWPLTHAISLFLKYSNNAIGETLVKAMGRHRRGQSGESDSTRASAVESAPGVVPSEPTVGVATAATRERRQGTWPNGMAAMRRELDALGIDLSGAVLSDGSGLSYENKVTPIVLVSALRLANESFDFGPEFLAALPIAGADGTLQERATAAEGRVRAKTGLLTRVTSLSGYAIDGTGERLVFSILVNGFRKGAGSAMDAVDAIAFELTR